LFNDGQSDRRGEMEGFQNSVFIMRPSMDEASLTNCKQWREEFLKGEGAISLSMWATSGNHKKGRLLGGQYSWASPIVQPPPKEDRGKEFNIGKSISIGGPKYFRSLRSFSRKKCLLETKDSTAGGVAPAMDRRGDRHPKECKGGDLRVPGFETTSKRGRSW